MKIKTYQVSGAGNTFSVVWDDFTKDDILNRSELVKTICTLTHTDGFIFLKSSVTDTASNNHFTWDFYNNDGSAAEMCGNATRCVAFYVHNILKNPAKNLKLDTIAGVINIFIVDETQFTVQMTPIEKFEHSQYFWCDTGVPHIIIETNNFTMYSEQKDFCRKMRFLADFQPRGTNVTLVELATAPNKLKAVSYERGVEDFTKACGTGAMAAAYYNLCKRQQSETLVEMPGGLLKMNLSDLTAPLMSGPAILLGEYIYESK